MKNIIYQLFSFTGITEGIQINSCFFEVHGDTQLEHDLQAKSSTLDDKESFHKFCQNTLDRVVYYG